jgi:hypothetical protein
MPDMRCFVGGDAAVVCATCVGGLCGASGLACATDADCQQYVGRCSSGTGLGSQPCDPLDNGTNPIRTDCPGGQVCNACFGPVAVGACVGGANLGLACRVDSQCPGSTCGVDVDGGLAGAGAPYYPEVPGPAVGGVPHPGNPLGLPPGYNTYGFSELELDTKCNGPGPADDRLGRIGLIAPMPGILPQPPARLVAVPLAFIATTGKAASQVIDVDTTGGLFDDAIFGRSVGATAAIGLAEPGAPATPLSGGTYAAGRVFPVDPTGPACCNGGGNILGTKNTTFGNARANKTVNGAGALTWLAGTQGTQPPTTPFMRASGWGPGANRTVGCIGDNSEVSGGSQFPNADVCNDALGLIVQNRCTGDDCTNLNTGLDDAGTTASIGGAPAVRVIAARAKVGNPGGVSPSLPIIYNVGGLTGIDIDIGAPAGESNTDFSATVETFNCPLVGTCAVGGAACVLNSDCAGGANGPCQNRVKTCVNIFDPCAGIGDFDADGVCDPTDTCPTVPDIVGALADPDGDGVNNACDNCRDVSNPAWPVANSTANRHRTGGGIAGGVYRGQLDDDVDGRGNRCDFDYNQAAIAVGAPDTALMVTALGPPARNISQNNCGPAGLSACGIHDNNENAAGIGAPDSALLFSLLAGGAATTGLNNSPNRHCGVTPAQTCGQNANQPCCSPFSRALGSVPGPVLNKAICLNATGVGAPQRCVFTP